MPCLPGRYNCLRPDFDLALFNLRMVFLRMRQAGLQLKASKCKLMQQETVFLGHLISPEGITCNPDKTKTIRDWPAPRDKTELQSILGLMGYYRKIVPAYAELAIPLTKKKVKFKWGPEQESAFEKTQSLSCTTTCFGFSLREWWFVSPRL